jgi:hypothetical protein
MTKITEFIIFIFLEGILTIETKDTYGIWMYLIFEQLKYSFLLSCHGLHCIFSPPTHL